MTEVEWTYLENVQNIVLIGRCDAAAVALIELCPTKGFRLTDCADASVEYFQSLEEAKRAAEFHSFMRHPHESSDILQM